MFKTASDRRRFAMQVAAFYGALFVVIGTHVPYLPVWLEWRGLTAGEISLVLSAPYFLRLLVTPSVALFADHHQAHRRTLVIAAWCSLMAVLALSNVQSFWPILVLVLLMMVSSSTIMPLIETIAVSGVRAAGLDYGRMRLWGSLTFIVASVAGGFAVAKFGGGIAIWLIAGGCLLTVIAAHALPKPKARSETAVQDHVLLMSSASRLQLLRQKPFVLFVCAAGLTQASHATLLGFGSLLWQKQGLDGGLIGMLWAVGVIAEIGLFAFSATVLEKVRVVWMLIFAAAVSVVRWGVMAMEPALPVLLPLQVLHGITFGASHIGAMYFLRQAVPEEVAGTAQALYATFAAGIAMGSATLIAGAIYAEAGVLAYAAMGAIALIGLGAAILLFKTWQGEPLVMEAAKARVPLPPEAGAGR